MFELPEKVRNLTPYEPIAGSYSIRLDANESFIEFPEEIKAEMSSALYNTALNRYPDSEAKKVIKGFADYFKISPSLVTAGNGSDELISVIMTSFLDKGDKFITLEPDFSMYRFYGSLAGGESVAYKKDSELKTDIDKVIALSKAENARLIIFSNPCNPTGGIVTRRDVCKLLESTDALVVADEAYMDFAEDESVISLTEKYDNLIVLKTCSKALGAAALRLGFAASNQRLTTVLKSVKSPYNVNSVSQALGEVIFSHPDFIDDCRKKAVQSKKELFSMLSEKAGGKVKIFESHTNFVFLKAENAKEVFEKLKSRGIIIRNMGDFLRITAGTAEENRAVVNELAEILEVQK